MRNLRRWGPAAVVIGLLAAVFTMALFYPEPVEASSWITPSGLAVTQHPADIDTSGTFSLFDCDQVDLWVAYDGDSSKVTLQTSIDGSHWAAVTGASALQLNGAVNTWAIQTHLAFTVAGTVGANGVPLALGTKGRLIINNDDAADTLKVFTVRLRCGY